MEFANVSTSPSKQEQTFFSFTSLYNWHRFSLFKYMFIKTKLLNYWVRAQKCVTNIGEKRITNPFVPKNVMGVIFLVYDNCSRTLEYSIALITDVSFYLEWTVYNNKPQNTYLGYNLCKNRQVTGTKCINQQVKKKMTWR